MISKGKRPYQAGVEGSMNRPPTFSPPLPNPRDHIEHAPTLGKDQQHVCSVSAQGSQLKTQSSEVLLGAGHIGITTRHRYWNLKIVKGKQVFSASGGQKSLTSIWNNPKAEFPDASQGSSPKACPSKEGKLRSAMLTPTCSGALKDQCWSIMRLSPKEKVK